MVVALKRYRDWTEQTRKVKVELEAANKDNVAVINTNFKLIADMLAEIGKKIE